jgi:hypothetical protein
LSHTPLSHLSQPLSQWGLFCKILNWAVNRVKTSPCVGLNKSQIITDLNNLGKERFLKNKQIRLPGTHYISLKIISA